MSSVESRAAEATAWQRAVLDELGAPPAGLARLTPRGTVPALPTPPASPAPPPAPPAFPPPAPQAPPAPMPPPPASALETARQPIFTPSPNAEATSFDRPPRAFRPPPAGNAAPAHRVPAAGRGRPPAYDPPRGTPQPPFSPPARRDLPAAERTNFDPAPGAHRNPATQRTTIDPSGGARHDRPAAPPAAPPSAPRADPHPEALLRRSRHGDPMLRRFAREVRKVTGASQDSYQDTSLAEALQQPVTTGRRIAVTSIRGGAGKSVVSALMSTALAHFRQDRVLVVDADPGIGSLMLRLGMTSAPSLRHLADGRADAGSFDAVRTHLAQTDAGVWALGGTEDRFGQVNLEDYRTATGLLGRYFGVTVTDCGAGLTDPLHEGILAEAHAQVMVTPATPDGAISARRALDLLAGAYGELATRTTVVFVTHAAGAGINLDRAIAMMPPWCPRVEHLAFDRHLADGSFIDASRLAEPTRVAALRIAAAALTLAAGRSVPK